MVVLNQAARALDRSGDQRAAALIRLDVAAAQAEPGEIERARPSGAARDTLRRLRDPAGEAAALGVLASLAMQGGQPVVAESLYRAGLDLRRDLRPACRGHFAAGLPRQRWRRAG